MAEKSAKKKTKKAAKGSGDASVLGNLSATRPTRLGGDRRAATTASAAKTSAASTPKAPAKPKAARKPKAAAKPKTAAQPKSAAQPKAAKTSAPKAAEAKAAKLRKPAPAPPAGWQVPDQDGRRQGGPPSGTDIVTTAVQAAGELAQLGVTIGGQLLKRAAGRIPRP
jgi:hypothetical protein